MGLLDFIKKALYPSNFGCIVCGAEIAPCRSGVCPDCALPYNDGKICMCCGKAINNQSSYCEDCPTARHEFDQNRSALLLDDDVRRIIHTFKYGGGLWLAPYLAEPVARTITLHNLPADILLPVPMHPNRIKKRGYNQAAALADEVGKLLDIPVASGALLRVIDTPYQARFSRAQRLKNLDGAFKLACPDMLTGKKVLIIDDVLTTGSTVDSCAREVRRAGATAINSATLASAVKKK